MTPTIERINGGWLVYAIIGDYLERRRYFDYTKREALALFRAEFKGQS